MNLFGLRATGAEVAMVRGALASDTSDPSRDRARTGATLSVATFNVHAGVDGWGRPFDVVGACRALDTDIIVLEETWTPASGTGVAAAVAEALGYVVFEQPLAAGRLAGPHPRADDRWMKPFDWRGASHAIYLDSERPFRRRVRRSRRYLDAEPGRWGVAVLSRVPARLLHVIDLGRLKQDRARRSALVVEVEVGGATLTVIGTHMSHISYGAPLQFLRLSRAIRQLVPPGPAVLAGDMNLWGPPVTAFFPAWHRAVRGRTWPAWRPHSQVDHILVRNLEVRGGEALESMGSDHRPLQARLAVAA